MRRPNLLVALLLVNVAANARGAVALPRTTGELTRDATYVVRGIVDRVLEARDEAVHHQVVETTLRVEEGLKGSPPATLVIRQLKGIPGDARFKVGEEVVVFVREGRAAESGFHFLLGLSQGKYAVKRSLRGPVVIERDLTDLRLASPRARANAPPEAVTTLDELRRRVKEEVVNERRAP